MIQTIRRLLKAADVSFVRILWCDNANIIRVKASHIDHLSGLKKGVGISAAQQALPVMFDGVAPNSGLGPVGEAQLVPDWSTLNVLPFAKGHAQVIGDMRLGENAWEHCPRQFLRDQLAFLEEEGIQVKAAFENEFFLLEKTDTGYKSADQTIYAMTSAMNQHADFILDLVTTLEAQGITVEYYYPESGPGQQELSMRYTDGLSAADQQIIFRESTRGVAANHGLVASFLPKIIENAAGSGCHINLSLWQGETAITGDPSHPTGLTEEAQAFIAGILHHLPALSALSIPSNNSFRRIRPHFWAGAFTTWGYGNREAAVRVTKGDKGANRFELKTADASANPYLALGSILAAGLDGIKEKRKLAQEVCIDPALVPEAERNDKKIFPLPTNLGEALEELKQNPVLMRALGPARAKAYIAVKTMEHEATKDLDLDEEVNLLAERY